MLRCGQGALTSAVVHGQAGCVAGGNLKIEQKKGQENQPKISKKGRKRLK
jgi:hypothetical protein